jgi:hypothetical protein
MFGYGKIVGGSGAYLGYAVQVPQGGSSHALADELAAALVQDHKLAAALTDGEIVVTELNHDQCVALEAQIRAAARNP